VGALERKQWTGSWNWAGERSWEVTNDVVAFASAGGGLSWETSSERLRAYFENFGVVREAFVSYNRNNGRPRGFGFVVFESPEVADKVVATKHTVDRREVGFQEMQKKLGKGLGGREPRGP
jgi:hypothetical protein